MSRSPTPEPSSSKADSESKEKSISPAPSEKAENAKEGDEKTENEPNPWQAIWSPQYNAYYFFNASTNETTWSNPLQPDKNEAKQPDAPSIPEEPVAGPSTAGSQYTAAQQAALAQGIDPSLAYLDPTLGQSTVPGAPGSAPSFAAKFNARTGRFTALDGRDPSHMSEYERAKRMSEFYFDTDAWSKEVDQRYRQGEAAGEEDDVGKKRKRPNKKDLDRFREQKKAKKLAKTAWLRQ
ncbi:hypothetical protein DL96DRAFT_1605510 [Flagelloscypha sp. PMI_526]|nr:hypothetical protein DL96DRAFT_1605510 [Flagelloscypha sp. PMI_526]